jgi:hypothetical protein
MGGPQSQQLQRFNFDRRPPERFSPPLDHHHRMGFGIATMTRRQQSTANAKGTERPQPYGS